MKNSAYYVSAIACILLFNGCSHKVKTKFKLPNGTMLTFEKNEIDFSDIINNLEQTEYKSISIKKDSMIIIGKDTNAFRSIDIFANYFYNDEDFINKIAKINTKDNNLSELLESNIKDYNTYNSFEELYGRFKASYDKQFQALLNLSESVETHFNSPNTKLSKREKENILAKLNKILTALKRRYDDQPLFETTSKSIDYKIKDIKGILGNIDSSLNGVKKEPKQPKAPNVPIIF
jgi:hypothetical protein